MAGRVPEQDASSHRTLQPASSHCCLFLERRLLGSSWSWVVCSSKGQTCPVLGSPLSRRSRPHHNSNITRPVWPDQTAAPPWAVQESSFSTSSSFIILEPHWSLAPVFLDSLPSLLHAWAVKDLKNYDFHLTSEAIESNLCWLWNTVIAVFIIWVWGLFQVLSFFSPLLLLVLP